MVASDTPITAASALLVIPNCAAARRAALVSTAASEGAEATLGLAVGILITVPLEIIYQKDFHGKEILAAVATCSASLRRGAGCEPGRQQAALVVGHLGDVAGRHGARAHRVDLDQVRMAPDAAGIVEHDALGRRVDARPDRLVAMAHAAAGEDHGAGGRDVGALRARAARRFPRTGGGEPRHREHAGAGDAPGPPRAASALVAGVEEM